MSKTQAPVVNVNEVSRISTGTVLKGEINSPVDLRIDGIFEGRIFSSGRVVVGEKADGWQHLCQGYSDIERHQPGNG